MKQQITDELFNELYYRYGTIQKSEVQILADEEPLSLEDIAAQCKIYAIKNGYEIASGLTPDKSRECGFKPAIMTLHIKSNVRGEININKDTETEAQAVIRATEYIYKKKLSQRKNKNKNKDKR